MCGVFDEEISTFGGAGENSEQGGIRRKHSDVLLCAECIEIPAVGVAKQAAHGARAEARRGRPFERLCCAVVFEDISEDVFDFCKDGVAGVLQQELDFG